VKGGRIEEARMLLAHAARALIAQGADALLLACTEIPVALAGVSLDVPAIDPTDALARAGVGWWLEARSEPAPLHTQL
jgi:aspartate racemase